MAKTPEDSAAAMIANLPAKTGKPLAEWLQAVAKSQLSKHGQIVAMLKSQYNIGHGYANLIAHESARAAAGGAALEGDGLIEAQYTGAKAALRPIYDKVIEAVEKFGGDLEISPKKGYVSLRRNKQFALVQPSTATRLDVGINLKGAQPTDRLEPSGSFNAMVSHRVRVSKPADVDKELIGWLRQAYEAS